VASFCRSAASIDVTIPATDSGNPIAPTAETVTSNIGVTILITGSANRTSLPTTLVTSTMMPATTKISFVTPSGFTGQSILTGLCSQPYEVTATISSATHTVMFEGCGKLRPECCPNVEPSKPFPTSGWDFTDAPLTLKICPADYRRHGRICCPSYAALIFMFTDVGPNSAPDRNATPAREPLGRQTICVGRTDIRDTQTGVTPSMAMQTSFSVVATATPSGNLNPRSADDTSNIYINTTYIGCMVSYGFPVEGGDKWSKGSFIVGIIFGILTSIGACASFYSKCRTGNWLFFIGSDRRHDDRTICYKKMWGSRLSAWLNRRIEGRAQRTCARCVPDSADNNRGSAASRFTELSMAEIQKQLDSRSSRSLLTGPPTAGAPSHEYRHST
jgi:hypothetical protein